MSAKVCVVYLERTKHVLAAWSRTAAPSECGNPDDWPLDALALNFGATFNTATNTGTGGQAFLIDKAGLKTAAVDSVSDLLLRPRRYILNLAATEASSANPVAFNALTLSATNSNLQITLQQPVAKESKAWAQISGGDLSDPISGLQFDLPLNSAVANFGCSGITVGVAYDVLILVEGLEPIVGTRTAT